MVILHKHMLIFLGKKTMGNFRLTNILANNFIRIHVPVITIRVREVVLLSRLLLRYMENI